MTEKKSTVSEKDLTTCKNTIINYVNKKFSKSLVFCGAVKAVDIPNKSIVVQTQQNAIIIECRIANEIRTINIGNRIKLRGKIQCSPDELSKLIINVDKY